MHILVPRSGFYIQHVWVWSHNPAGMFVDWNPKLDLPVTGASGAVRP